MMKMRRMFETKLTRLVTVGKKLMVLLNYLGNTQRTHTAKSRSSHESLKIEESSLLLFVVNMLSTNEKEYVWMASGHSCCASHILKHDVC